MKSKFIIKDKVVFEKLYNQYYKALVGFAYSYINDQNAGEDIVQDVFYSLWNQKREYSDESTFKVYLYKATRNRCINYIRHQQVKDEYSKEQIKLMETEENLLKRIMTEEVYRILYNFINDLSDKRKEVILLSLKGYSNAEIAEDLNISLDTVKTHKKKVYNILREKMKNHAFLLYILLGI